MKYWLSVLLIFGFISVSVAQQEMKPLDTSSHIPTITNLPIVTNNPDAKVVNVLAVDLDHSGKFSLKQLLNGNNAILVMHKKTRAKKVIPKGEINIDNLYLFQRNEILARLDSTQNGRIDAIEPAFHYLYLAVFNNDGKTVKLVPIRQAGIRVLFLPKQIMKQHRLNRGKGFADHANHALKSDGSTMKIQPIAISQDILAKIGEGQASS